MSHSTPLLAPERPPLLVVISGPSGAGKDALLARIKQSGFPIEHITTVTTRPRRPNEKDMVDYHFVTEAAFQQMLANNELLESARVYGNWYGVPATSIRQTLADGKDTIVKVDVQGAATIKRIEPQAVFIFVTPPTIEDLLDRLRQRNTESAFDLDLRTRTAAEELRQMALFDYVVINPEGQIDCAVLQVQAIIAAEKCRLPPRKLRL